MHRRLTLLRTTTFHIPPNEYPDLFDMNSTIDYQICHRLGIGPVERASPVLHVGTCSHWGSCICDLQPKPQYLGTGRHGRVLGFFRTHMANQPTHERTRPSTAILGVPDMHPPCHTGINRGTFVSNMHRQPCLVSQITDESSAQITICGLHWQLTSGRIRSGQAGLQICERLDQAPYLQYHFILVLRQHFWVMQAHLH